jgi:precorrin-8X/cobalt-precorrin-8 methylmutase
MEYDLQETLPDVASKKAVLLLGHGSPVREANEVLREVARSIQASGGYASVQPAFLQFEEPDFHAALDLIVRGGVKDVIVTPYFLYRGSHVKNDLPRLIDAAREKYPDVSFTIAPTLGFHPRLVDVAIERIEQAEGKDESPRADLFLAQHPIERESFSIIDKELGGVAFSQDELAVVKRVIHATADFEYKDILRFSPGATRAGVRAVEQGRNIITDVRMVEAGITKERLSVFGGEGGGRVLCFSSHRDVLRTALSGGTTRTAVSMRKGARFMEGGIAVVGNAPTALRELLRLVGKGEARPALVVGVPVGFVGAEEAKEELMLSGCEFITCKGKKGGTPVAVSIVNALIIEAVRAAYTGT